MVRSFANIRVRLQHALPAKEIPLDFDDGLMIKELLLNKERNDREG
jgi:hypothetical protein